MNKFKFLIIFPVIILIISIAGNITGFIIVYKIYDKYNDLRLDPLNNIYKNNIAINEKYYNIVILGDSLASNWKYNDESILNLGIGSQTSSQIRLRSDMYKNKIKGNILIIITGGNDIKSLGTNYKRKDEVVRNSLENIRKIILNHQSNFNKIVVITIPPIFKIPLQYRFFYNSKIINEAHFEINNGIRKFTDELNTEIIDSYEILNSKKNSEKLSTDGLHLNKQAYKYLELEIEKLLYK